MKENAKSVVYAVVGAGDAVVEKALNVRKLADREFGSEMYNDVVKRGRNLSTRIRNAAPSKRAADQTRTARTQVRGAARGVARAVKANAEAGRSAVRKVARA